MSELALTLFLAQLDTYKIGQTAAWNIRMYCAAWPYAVAPLKPLSLKAPMLFVTADFDARYVRHSLSFVEYEY